MANILATGRGLIGSYLARQEQEDKWKRQQDALAEFMVGNGLSGQQPATPAAPPAMRPEPLPDYKQRSLAMGFQNPGLGNIDLNSRPVVNNPDGIYGKESLLPTIGNNGQQNGGGFSEYGRQFMQDPVRRRAMQLGQNLSGPVQAPTQMPAQAPGQSSTMQQPNPDWVNQATAGLVKKGVPFQQAYQLASQMYQQKDAEYRRQQVAAEFPKLRSSLADAIRSNDRASAVSVILQIQQMGGKVPTELIQWAAPNYQSRTNDLGDREVNVAFNPATGQFTTGQEFTKGQSPDSAAANALNWAKFNYTRDRDILGDKGQTWQSRRGKNEDDDEVDPNKQANNLKNYSKFTNELWEGKEGGSKTPQEIAALLNNNNVMAQWKARAAAAHGSKAKAQYQNDVTALADAYGLVYENGAWRVR
jgi:hypothetical protein